MLDKNYCMQKKCKICDKQLTCDLLENLYKERLMYNPFENIKQLLEQKHDKTR